MIDWHALLLWLFLLFAPADVAPVEQPGPVKFVADAPHEPAAVHAPSMPASTQSDRPTTPHSPPSAPTPPPLPEVVDPGCAVGEEWQGEFGCVAVQLEGERNGRAYG
jgi:hypothetical protein